MKRKQITRAALAAVLALLAADAAQAANYYWVGTGNWSDTARWAATSGGAGDAYANPPGVGDDVFFDGGSSGACSINVDVSVKSLSISGYAGTITFLQGTTANIATVNDFTLGSGATLVATYASLTGNGTGRVITVGGNAVIAGVIDADGKGFPGTQGPGTGSRRRGGTHGGIGFQNVNLTYGSVTEPVSLGSGGGQEIGFGLGGGAIKLVVTGSLSVNGTIRANGTNSTFGGGAGGSIWLVSDQFSGSGTLRSDGGNGTESNSGAGGSGGRIAIQAVSDTFSGTVSVAGGTGTAAHIGRGQPGTLWHPNRFAGLSTVLIGTSYQYYAPASVTNSIQSLTVSNVWVEFHQGGLHLNHLAVTNATLRFDRNMTLVNNFGLDALSVTGSVKVTGASALHLPAQGTYTLAGDLTVGAGATLFARGNTAAINSASGGTAGAPHGEGVTITCASAVIDGIMSADERGFQGIAGPGAGSRRVGGTYGGIGANGTKLPYGQLTEPSALGSGGSDSATTGLAGGAITLVATGTLHVNGTISASGGNGMYGGGSGGSIWLVADQFSGSGALYANGGNGTENGSGAGGGGGRIAIQVATKSFSGTLSAAGGIGTAAHIGRAQPGTLWFPQLFAGTTSPVISSGYQYYQPVTVTNGFDSLTVNGVWVEFQQGGLEIGSLVVTNGGTLRFDRNVTRINNFGLDRLSVTGSIAVVSSGSRLALPAEGTYALADDLTVGSGATLFVRGNTTELNEASGGTVGNPHGIGVTITCANGTVDGLIDADWSGFRLRTGPGAGARFYGASHGGLGWRYAEATYGVSNAPTALGSGGGNAGCVGAGGAVKLDCRGTLAINGTITANGSSDEGSASGGSVWLRGTRFEGNGTIRANGGTYTTTSGAGGGGGRIAIEYGKWFYTGTTNVLGGLGGPTGGPGAPGTVYTAPTLAQPSGTMILLR